jgi:hypothetical protein
MCRRRVRWQVGAHQQLPGTSAGGLRGAARLLSRGCHDAAGTAPAARGRCCATPG